ncbi:MAG: GxxExxY protein [Bacteroidota bacterium]|nr:GxxExxY protein [Bacteroidota bacterium]
MTQKLINDLAYRVVACAIEVHKQLGPGLLESIYEECFIEELKSGGFNVTSQEKIPLVYKGKTLKTDLKLDILVNDCIIVELKSVEEIHPVYKAQLLTYLKLTGMPKGLLINFNCDNVTKSGLVSLVTEKFALLPKE